MEPAQETYESGRITKMGLRIQNNIAALNAHRNLQSTDSALAKSMQRLSSGYRINSGADDAAGLAIANSMRADIVSFRVASRNASEANSLLQVANGALEQVSAMLNRLKELATQASSGNADSNRDKIDSEAQKVILEIDRIATSTEYADAKLINGSFGVTVATSVGLETAVDGFVDAKGMLAGESYTFADTASTLTVTHAGGSESILQSGISAPSGDYTKDIYFDSIGLTVTINSDYTAADFNAGVIGASATGSSEFQIGAENQADNRVSISLGNAQKSALGTTGSVGSAISAINLTTAASAQLALDIIDDAISDLSQLQGDVGAYQNRLAFAAANLSITVENVQASESVIRDVDMAFEMTTFTKNQILLQSGTAMLAQANLAPQQVLALFA